MTSSSEAARLAQILPRLKRHGAPSAGSLFELLLFLLIGLQCLRFLHALTTPLPMPPAAPPSAPASAEPFELRNFDPFFRSAGGEPLPKSGLTLHGTRTGAAAAGNGAILGMPDGEQRSFAVGELVLPDIVLAAVRPGDVTLAVGQGSETIFLAERSGSDAAGGGRGPGQQSPAPRPGGSINFADPRTLPPSLTSPRPAAGAR
jgi:general secretion pathway protein C